MEFFGGLLLLLGLFTRIAAVPLVIVMIVAVISAKWGQVDSLETLLGFEELAYMALFGWLAVAGPGPSRSTGCCRAGASRQALAAPRQKKSPAGGARGLRLGRGGGCKRQVQEAVEFDGATMREPRSRRCSPRHRAEKIPQSAVPELARSRCGSAQKKCPPARRLEGKSPAGVPGDGTGDEEASGRELKSREWKVRAGLLCCDVSVWRDPCLRGGRGKRAVP